MDRPDEEVKGVVVGQELVMAAAAGVKSLHQFKLRTHRKSYEFYAFLKKRELSDGKCTHDVQR